MPSVPRSVAETRAEQHAKPDATLQLLVLAGMLE